MGLGESNGRDKGQGKGHWDSTRVYVGLTWL